MTREIIIKQGNTYITNTSLGDTLADISNRGIDIDNLGNNILGVSDFSIVNFLKHRNFNDKNKIDILRELMKEIMTNPYFYFAHLDNNLLFNSQSLALVYSIVNRIPCVVEYSNYKKSQVDAFINAVIKWYDLSYVSSPICKLVRKSDLDTRDRNYDIMRRPSNALLSLDSLCKRSDISYMINFGLILIEDIDRDARFNKVLVKLAELTKESYKDLQPIKIVTKTDVNKLKKTGLEWKDEYFEMSLDELYEMIDSTSIRSLVIKFK